MSNTVLCHHTSDETCDFCIPWNERPELLERVTNVNDKVEVQPVYMTRAELAALPESYHCITLLTH